MTNTNKYADEVNKIKRQLLLEYLFTFGNDVVDWGQIVTKVLDPYDSNDIDDIFVECCEQGYISRLEDPFTKINNYKITKEGLRFLNKGEKHE